MNNIISKCIEQYKKTRNSDEGIITVIKEVKKKKIYNIYLNIKKGKYVVFFFSLS